jgi:hypothetical protein
VRVYVPTYSGASNVAELVLHAEGVEYQTFPADSDLGYSLLMTEVWKRGEGFVIVEHDVAPWFGAVAQLEACPRDWCLFHYPDGGALSRGLGCTKFSDRLVRDHSDLPDAWEGTEWPMIDGAVGSAFAAVLRQETPEQHPVCYHGPPVAHARRPG